MADYDERKAAEQAKCLVMILCASWCTHASSHPVGTGLVPGSCHKD
jgi:hypothetical protein